MRIFFFDSTKCYIGNRELEENELIPQNATTVNLTLPKGKQARFVDSEWVLSDLPEEVVPIAENSCAIYKPIRNCVEFGNTYSYNAMQGLAAGHTFRHEYKASAVTHQPQLIYGNFYNLTDGKDTANPYNITVKASIERSDGTIIPLRFNNGAVQAIIASGGMAITDPCGIKFEKDEIFYVRTFASVPADNNTLPAVAQCLGWHSGDYLAGGDLTWGPYICFGPCAIIGRTSQNIVVAGIGDSIMCGQGDGSLTATDGHSVQSGYFCRALINKLPFINLAKSNQRLVTFLLSSGHWNRANLLNYCTHAICGLGVNDMADDFNTVTANMQRLWQFCAEQGLKVYQMTITPRTTSTDNWATAKNQTPVASESVRVAINEWLRTCPAPLKGIFDIADVLETSHNSGIWKPNYTADGTHPAQQGHIDMSAIIDMSKFN